MTEKDNALSDSKLAEIWLSGQDLTDKTPEQVKELYFDAWHKIQKTNVEQWQLVWLFDSRY